MKRATFDLGHTLAIAALISFRSARRGAETFLGGCHVFRAVPKAIQCESNKTYMKL